MRILVLGGSRFVGRAVVAYAVACGHRVTVLNRGSVDAEPGARQLIADRLDPAKLRDVLADAGDFDLLVDTWSEAPAAVAQAATLLAPRVGHAAYVSSRSVYAWPIPPYADESAGLVDGDPAAEATDYAADKRGGELAILRAFGQRSLIARPGIILGPHEDIGRLPYWLDRVATESEFLAPGTPDRPLQYIDARDLARWLIDEGISGRTGIFDTVSRPGHTTTGALIDACRAATGSSAKPVWVDEAWLTARDITGWVDLPIWAPVHSDINALHNGDTSAAYAAGLTCRPVEETVADTWAWLRSQPGPPRNDTYLSRDRERALLAEWRTAQASGLPR